MTVREILKMGDPRLLRIAKPIEAFDVPELHSLIADMFETMHSVNGAGLAAPQIGVDLALVTALQLSLIIEIALLHKVNLKSDRARGEVRVDAGIRFFRRNSQRQYLLFGKVFEIFGHGVVVLFLRGR